MKITCAVDDIGRLMAGYKEVYNVLGSVKAWVAAGFPTTSG